MKKIKLLFALPALLALTSCTETLNVQKVSNTDFQSLAGFPYAL